MELSVHYIQKALFEICNRMYLLNYVFIYFNPAFLVKIVDHQKIRGSNPRSVTQRPAGATVTRLTTEIIFCHFSKITDQYRFEK